MKVIIYILLICLCIGFLVGCAIDDAGSTDYRWYIKIYMPDGVIEGPGCFVSGTNCGLVTVEIDGIRYRVGSQNILITKLPTP